MRDENLNLNKNLLGKEGIYREYILVKGGQAKCVRLRTKRERGSNFGDFVRTYYVGDPLCNYFSAILLAGKYINTSLDGWKFP